MTVMSQSAQLSPAQFNVDDLPPSNRKKAWTDALLDFFFEHETTYPGRFEFGELRGASVQGFRTATVRSDPMVVHRHASHIAQDSMDGYYILLPEGDKIGLSQHGRETTVSRGQFTYVCTTEPYIYEQHNSETFHVLTLPGALVRARKPDIEDGIAICRTGYGLERLFVDFAVSFCKQSRDIAPLVGEELLEQLVDVFTLATEGADPETDETAVQSLHRRRAQHAIEQNFRDPDFNLKALAQTLQLSERYIQKIFATKDERASTIIRQRRIDEACRLLRNRSRSRASISEIAYSVGFSDPAHFSRVFRRELGVSPRDISS